MEPRGGARSLCGCRSPFQKAPLSVCITGAAGQTAYNLVYHIASGYVFGDDQVRGCAATLFYFLFLFGAAGRAAEPCAVVVASFLRAVSAADTRRIVMMVPSQPTRRNPLSLSLSSPPPKAAATAAAGPAAPQGKDGRPSHGAGGLRLSVVSLPRSAQCVGAEAGRRTTDARCALLTHRPPLFANHTANPDEAFADVDIAVLLAGTRGRSRLDPGLSLS